MIRDRGQDRDVDAVNGAFMLLRTDLLRSLGGLDESVFMYLEDADLCRRVRDARLRVRFVAGAPAVHGGGTSTARGDPDAPGPGLPAPHRRRPRVPAPLGARGERSCWPSPRSSSTRWSAWWSPPG